MPLLFFLRKKKRKAPVESEDKRRVIKQILDEVKKTASFREEVERKISEFSESVEKVKKFEQRLNDLSVRVDRLERRFDETNRKLDKISKSIEQLLSLYELIFSKSNPFTETPTEKSEELPETIGEEGAISVATTKTEKAPEILPKPKVSREEELERKVEEIIQKNLEKFEKELERTTEKEEREKIEEEAKTAEEAFTSYLEMAKEKIVPLSKLSKDYVSLTTALTWLGYLVERLGNDGTIRLLKFYVDIGWLSPEVFAELVKLVKGIKRTATYQPLEKPEVKDHLVSLYFIAKLKGIKIEEDFTKIISNIIQREDLKDVLNYKYPGEEE